VAGADFLAQHKFFENQYEELDEIPDSVAERIYSKKELTKMIRKVSSKNY
jgi:DNA-binding ferritin-like protein